MNNFEHGEEGTHSCCNKRLKEEGGKARCCYCVFHKDCGNDQPTPSLEPLDKDWEKELREDWEDRVHGGHFVDQLYPFSPNSKVSDDIADWWIEIVVSQKSQWIEKIEKMKINLSKVTTDTLIGEGVKLEIRNKALSEVQEILKDD